MMGASRAAVLLMAERTHGVNSRSDADSPPAHAIPGWAPAAQAVGGNAALAVLLTVGTNLAGIFTMPFVLCGLLGAGRQAVVLAPGALLRNLLRSILAPLLVGAAARAFIPGDGWGSALQSGRAPCTWRARPSCVRNTLTLAASPRTNPPQHKPTKPHT